MRFILFVFALLLCSQARLHRNGAYDLKYFDGRESLMQEEDEQQLEEEQEQQEEAPDASTENDDNQDAIEEAGVAEEPSSDASTENDDNQDTSEETGVAEEPPSGGDDRDVIPRGIVQQGREKWEAWAASQGDSSMQSLSKEEADLSQEEPSIKIKSTRKPKRTKKPKSTKKPKNTKKPKHPKTTKKPKHPKTTKKPKHPKPTKKPKHPKTTKKPKKPKTTKKPHKHTKKPKFTKKPKRTKKPKIKHRFENRRRILRPNFTHGRKLDGGLYRKPSRFGRVHKYMTPKLIKMRNFKGRYVRSPLQKKKVAEMSGNVGKTDSTVTEIKKKDNEPILSKPI